MGIFDDLMGSITGGDGGASNDLMKIPGFYQQYLGPYWQQGTNALGMYGKALSGLVGNPTGLEDQIMGHYQESPYAQFQTNQVTDQVNRAAAAGGQLGSPNSQYDMAGKIQGVVSADQQKYLGNAMQSYMGGLQGLGNLSGMGMQAGNTMANMYGNLYSNMAQMDYMNHYQDNQLFGGLVGAGANWMMNK